MENETSSPTWPDLAMDLFDRLAARNAEIISELENVEIIVPGKTGAEADRKKWTVNGVIKIRTSDHGK